MQKRSSMYVRGRVRARGRVTGVVAGAALISAGHLVVPFATSAALGAS